MKERVCEGKSIKERVSRKGYQGKISRKAGRTSSRKEGKDRKNERKEGRKEGGTEEKEGRI
jgi:hypothetical protein